MANQDDKLLHESNHFDDLNVPGNESLICHAKSITDCEAFECCKAVNNSDVDTLTPEEEVIINVREDCEGEVARDFTLVYAPQSNAQHGVISCDESTEVLSINSDTGKRSSHIFSGTDSDVEILMSDEINEPDWIAGYAKNEIDGREPFAEKFYTPTAKLGDLNQQDCNTDQDVSSVEEFSESSHGSYEQLTRSQLIATIEKQSFIIKKLKKTLHRYQSTQRKFLEQIDVLREEFNDIESTVIK